jgi:hypothetical protein
VQMPSPVVWGASGFRSDVLHVLESACVYNVGVGEKRLPRGLSTLVQNLPLGGRQLTTAIRQPIGHPCRWVKALLPKEVRRHYRCTLPLSLTQAPSLPHPLRNRRLSGRKRGKRVYRAGEALAQLCTLRPPTSFIS